MTAIIEVDNLSFEYPGKRALNSLSFSIPQGSVTALVGPNGAGKTTLLRCIAALQSPFSGSVVVGGVDSIDNPRAIHRQMGYLSDFFGLYDSLRVEQCLTHAAQMRGVETAALDESVAWVMQQLNLTDRAQVRASELSRGLRQRLAIAQAIVHRPQIALLDEPASGLDPQARAELSGLITRLSQSGMTLIVSSHILSELEAYSTHMMIIKDGCLTAHRPLGDADEEQRVIRLRLLQADVDIDRTLMQFSGVESIDIDGNEVRFNYLGDESGMQQLLNGLVSNGVPVVEFAVDRLRMEQVYIRDLDQNEHEEVRHES